MCSIWNCWGWWKHGALKTVWDRQTSGRFIVSLVYIWAGIMNKGFFLYLLYYWEIITSAVCSLIKTYGGVHNHIVYLLSKLNFTTKPTQPSQLPLHTTYIDIYIQIYLPTYHVHIKHNLTSAKLRWRRIVHLSFCSRHKHFSIKNSKPRIIH